MQTMISHLRKVVMLCASLALMALTFGSCANDIEEIQPGTEQTQTKYPTTTLRMYIATPDMDGGTQKIVNELASNAKTRGALTRGIVLDPFGKVETDQDFIATCYIINERTQQLGKFTYKWKTKRSKNNYLLLKDPNGGKSQNITIQWIKGAATNDISGNGWKACAVAGGQDKQVAGGQNSTMRHAVSFHPQNMVNDPEYTTTGEGSILKNANNAEPLAFVSERKDIKMSNGIPIVPFGFRMPGTLVKIKVKRDDNVSKSHNYFIKTNALHPMGVFCPIGADGKLKVGDISTWWESTCPIYTRNFESNDNYILHLDGNRDDALQLTEGGARYDVWYMWGMPTGKEGAETMMGSWTGGYILKQAKTKAQGPFISKHDFKNDGGKIRTLTANVHDSEPYPAFNFLNFLSRAAKHNVAAPKTWWDNDLYLQNAKWSDESHEWRSNKGEVWYSWDEAMQHKKVMPENNVWHTPSLTELTTLFPFPAVWGGWGNQSWDIYVCNGDQRTFKKETDLYQEWMTLYADMEDSQGYMFMRDLFPGNGGDLAEEQLKNLNTQGFFSHYFTTADGKKTYGIRFFRSTKYGDRLCCAYKWETKNWPDCKWTNENQLVVTSRWIGNAPLKVSDIMSDTWWNGEDSKYNVQVKLPCQAENTGVWYKNDHNAMTLVAGNTYQLPNGNAAHFARTFSSYKGGTFQRKNNYRKGFIHPFTNRQMCTERGKWGDEYFEEGSGKGTGKQWNLPKTGWHANPR